MTAPDVALSRVASGHLDLWTTDGPQCAQPDGTAYPSICTMPHGHPGRRHLSGDGRFVDDVWDEEEPW